MYTVRDTISNNPHSNMSLRTHCRNSEMDFSGLYQLISKKQNKLQPYHFHMFKPWLFFILDNSLSLVYSAAFLIEKTDSMNLSMLTWMQAHMHPSSSTYLILWQQAKQCDPDLLLTSNAFQLLPASQSNRPNHSLRSSSSTPSYTEMSPHPISKVAFTPN